MEKPTNLPAFSSRARQGCPPRAPPAREAGSRQPLDPDAAPPRRLHMVLGTLTEPAPPFSRVPPRGQIGPCGPTNGSALLRRA